MISENSVLRDYKITHKIGEGGMGSVYLAEDIMLDRKVALKILNPILTQDEQFTSRFRQEAKVQASLIHPNIVALYNFFQEDKNYCMVMEYAEGETLKELIKRTGPIPEERALKIFRKILEGVGYAHSKGVIHRDIKPSNIIVDRIDNVKVMDFGIAKIMGDRGMTKTGMKMGTVMYMSPEQVRAEKDIDQRTDIFSLGITLYEMLSGRVPYNTETDSDFELMNEIVNREIKDPREYYPHISEKTIELVYSMTEKDRNKRIKNITDIFTSIGIREQKFVKKGIEIISENEIMDILIDGKLIGSKTPCILDSVPANRFVLELVSDSHYSEPLVINPTERELIIKPQLKRFAHFQINSLYHHLEFQDDRKNSYKINTRYKIKVGNYSLNPSYKFLPTFRIDINESEEKYINYDELIKQVKIKIDLGEFEGEFNLNGLDTPFEEKFYRSKEFLVLPGKYKVAGSSNKVRINKEITISDRNFTVDLNSEIITVKKKQKKRIVAMFSGGGILLIALVLIIGLPIIEENNLWGDVKTKNTVESYDDYLISYPDGNYRTEAQQLREEARWEFAKEKNEEKLFSEYIKEYQNGKYFIKAMEYREPLMWERVTSENSENSYSDYIKEYPNGKYFQVSLDKREPFMWDRVSMLRSEEALNSYLVLYPNGRFSSQAQKLRDKIIWEKNMGSLLEDKSKWEIRKELVIGETGEPINSLIASIIEGLESYSGAGSRVTKEEFQSLFDRPESRIVYTDKLIRYATPQSQDIQTKEHEDYTKIFMKEKRQLAGIQFLKDYDALLTRAENEYGILKKDMVSILMWESGLGEFTGDYQIFNIFMAQLLFLDVAQTFAVKEMIAKGEEDPLINPSRKVSEKKRLERRKNDAAKSIVSLLRECKASGLDPLLQKGSWGGAIGYVQFMPYNLKYVVDADNNGTKDLFSWPDAIMSAASYLKNVGGYNSSEDGRKKAIKKYNQSDSYVYGVMLYADTVWDRYLRGN